MWSAKFKAFFKNISQPFGDHCFTQQSVYSRPIILYQLALHTDKRIEVRVAGWLNGSKKMMKSSGRNTTLWKWQNKTEHGSEYTNPNTQSILTVLTTLSRIDLNLRSTLGQNSLSDDRQLTRLAGSGRIVRRSASPWHLEIKDVYEKIWQVYFELRILISDPLYLYQTWELLLNEITKLKTQVFTHY